MNVLQTFFPSDYRGVATTLLDMSNWVQKGEMGFFVCKYTPE